MRARQLKLKPSANDRLTGFPLPTDMTLGLLISALVWYGCILPMVIQKPRQPIVTASRTTTAARFDEVVPQATGKTANIKINQLVLLESMKAGEIPPAPKPLVIRTKNRFHSMIVKAADRHNVDSALIKAIIMVESGYDHKAVSKSGAVGLMQLMPNTAEELGVEDVFDPERNINAGVRYFKRLMDRFGGDVRLALAAYNAGSEKVRRYQGIPPFKATHHYINKVFKYYQAYKNQRPKTLNNT